MPAVRIVKSFSVFYHIWMRWTTDLWNEIKEKALVFTLNTFLGRWSFYLKPHVFIEIIACTEFFTPRNSFDRIVTDLSVPSVVFTAYSCFSFKKRCFCSRAFVYAKLRLEETIYFSDFWRRIDVKKLVVLKLVRKCTPLAENDSCILILKLQAKPKVRNEGGKFLKKLWCYVGWRV